MRKNYRLGIDIGSTTVKAAVLDPAGKLLFSDYRRHFANIQETLADLLSEAREKLGEISLSSPAPEDSRLLSIWTLPSVRRSSPSRPP